MDLPCEPSSTRRDNASLLDANMYPHIIDSILSYASNEALMRLRCVSRHLKAQADALLLEHVLFLNADNSPTWRDDEEGGYDWLAGVKPRIVNLRNLFFSPTGRRLPALYALPDMTGHGTEDSANIARTLRGVRVLDCLSLRGVRPGDRSNVVSRANLKPEIIRTYGYYEGDAVAQAPTHVHLMSRRYPSTAMITTWPTATKLVICGLSSTLPWTSRLDIQRGMMAPKSLELKEIVFIFRSEDASQAQGDNRQAENEREDSANNAQGGSEEVEAFACARILHALLGFVEGISHKAKEDITNITIVDFPYPYSLAESCALRVFRTVFGYTRFVDSATYRAQVGERTWSFETDRSTFEAVVGAT